MFGESTLFALRGLLTSKERKKIIGFDFGFKRTGVAESTGSFLARPLSPLKTRGLKEMKEKILEAVLKGKPDLVLIGDCGRGPHHKTVLGLRKNIEGKGYPVKIVPEEYSTKETMEKLSYVSRKRRRDLKTTGKLDCLVAISFIEEYLRGQEML